MKDFDVSPEIGFLVSCHRGFTTTVPKIWIKTAQSLSKWLPTGNVRKIISSRISTWDEIYYNDLCNNFTKIELEDAMMYLSFITHAYIWGENDPVECIPKYLAYPLCKIASRLGRPPLLSYHSYGPNNWDLINKYEPPKLGNILVKQNFLGGKDEDWFIMIHIEIEATAGPILDHVVSAHNAVIEFKDDKIDERLNLALVHHLKEAGLQIKQINDTLCRMTEHCDPYIYYNRVRPFIHGWKNNPMYPDGMVYEGVTKYEGKGQYFRGETGSQSGIIPALDAALSIGHTNDELRTYLIEMRDYMPPKHKQFIEELEDNSLIRDAVLRSNNKEVVDAYNECVKWVYEFRSQHLKFAASFINKQAESGLMNPISVGTGGTEFMTYLKNHRDETNKYYIQVEK